MRSGSLLANNNDEFSLSLTKRISRRVKDAVHTNRYLSSLYEATQRRARDRTFALHLDHCIGRATSWRTAREVRTIALAQIQTLQSSAEPAARKGSPSINRLRADELAWLRDAVQDNAQPLTNGALDAAAKIASLEPVSDTAFTLYLAVLWLCNETVIGSLRSHARARVVVHLTCAPRLARADASIHSFDAAAATLDHVKLVGNERSFCLDTTTAVLGVPTGDGYEFLPQKVFHGLAILTLACNPSCILKIDDDHRLRSSAALNSLLQQAADSSEPLQLGEINRTALPSAHHRAWHFGKCSLAALNTRVLEMPTPAKWAAGSAGYILNRPALWRVLWASLYYRAWLEQILYEDIALAELAAKTGIRIVDVRMQSAITAVSEY